MITIKNNSRAFASPSKYIQGRGEINNLKEYASLYGNMPYVLMDSFIYDKMNEKIKEIFENNLVLDKFTGEICKEEIERIEDLLRYKSIDVVIGIGGGKTVDTSKVIASKFNVPVIIVPTAASTDAPTSALSVIYTKEGVHDSLIFHKANPNIVLLDSDIIKEAPVRLLVSGMGDALATYFEARVNFESKSSNFVGKGYRQSLTGMAIAKTCFDTLLEDGLKAKIACEKKVASEALENIIEANTLMSGLGFENTGCAAAHGLHDALTILKETNNYYHGEKVAFGVICELILENRSSEEIDKVLNFAYEVGLPITLEDIGIKDNSKEHLMKVASEAVKLSLYQNENINITEELVYSSIVMADNYGRQKKLEKNIIKIRS